MSPALRIERVTVARPGFTLDVGELDLPQGVTVLAGPNGAGKTTLMEALAGRVPTRRRAVLNDGQPLPPSQVALMTQRPELPRDMTVREVLTHTAWLAGLSRGAIQRSVNAVLSTTELEEHSAKRVSALSGGMRRRLAFGIIQVLDAPLAMLDEPTNDLDPHQRASLLTSVTQDATDRVVLVSTHSLREVAPLAEGIVVLDAGQVIWHSAMASFLDVHAPRTHDPEEAYFRCVDGSQ